MKLARRLRWHAGLGDGRLRAIARSPVYHREAVRALERPRQKAETLVAVWSLRALPKRSGMNLMSGVILVRPAELMHRVKAQLDPLNTICRGDS